MRERLQFMSDRIDALLALHRIPARVTGGTVAPRWIRFQVVPTIAAKTGAITGLNEELAAALGVPSCRVSRRGAAVDVQVPRDDPLPVQLLPLYRQLDDGDGGTASIPPLTAVLGLAEDGSPLLIRLPSPDVSHVLVAGAAGAGKTVLMQSMILSLAMANPAPSPFQANGPAGGLRLLLIDLQGHAFGAFRGLPHLARDVVRDAGEAAEALQSLVALMERRSGAPTYERALRGDPHVVLFVDGLADLLATGGEQIQQALARLTQRGREATDRQVGIHVVAAIDDAAMTSNGNSARLFLDPAAAFAGDPHAFHREEMPDLLYNFPVRLVGRVASAGDARAATGWNNTGAERLTGRGDFLAIAEGRVVRFQAAYVSSEEIHEMATRLAQNETVAPAAPLSWTQPLARLAEAFREGGSDV